MNLQCWLTVTPIAIAAISAGVAGWAVKYARGQAHAAKEQATAARDQATYAREQADAAKRQVSIEEQVHRDAAQPYVFVDFRTDPKSNTLVIVHIENSGPTVATNVRVEFDPPLKSSSEQLKQITESPAFTTSLSSLPPGRVMRFAFDVSFERLSSNLPTKYRVRITGDGPFGALEPLEYELDLKDYVGAHAPRNKDLTDVVSSLKEISKSIKKTKSN